MWTLDIGFILHYCVVLPWFYPLQFVFFFIIMKNALAFDSKDDEEKKLLIDLILFSLSCFQTVAQGLGVSIARHRSK